MSAHIKHTEDGLAMIRQDLERDRLTHIARHGGEDSRESDILTGRGRATEKEGKLGILMALAIVAAGVCTAVFAGRML